jgi:hypothetical protein
MPQGGSDVSHLDQAGHALTFQKSQQLKFASGLTITRKTLRKPCVHSEPSFVVLVINQGEQSEV